jgi:ABC-type transport system involved in multi-copper enzyme maturation permease subunit
VNVLTIAGASLREAWNRRLVLALIVLSLAFLALYLYGAHLLNARLVARAQSVAARNGGGVTLARHQMELFGMYVVDFLASFMAIFAGVGAIAGDLEDHSLQLVLAKPVRRWQVIAGKALGSGLVSVLYATALAVALLLGSRAVLGVSPPGAVPGILLMDLGVLVLSGLTLLASSVTHTLTAGVAMVMVYALAWTGGVLHALGDLTNIDVLATLGRDTRLLVPSDALWKAGSYYLQSPVMRAQEGPNPLFGVTAPDPAFLIYAGVYVVAAFVAAGLAFQRRDL